MENLISFKCSICERIDYDFNSSSLHEKKCQTKQKEKKDARFYLDSFRQKSSSLQELFRLINIEMSYVLDAVNTLKFYDKKQKIRPLKNLSFDKIGSPVSQKSYLKRPVYSAPIGINRASLWSKEENEEYYRAYNIKVSFDIIDDDDDDDAVTLLYLLDFIGGINILTGNGLIDKSCNHLSFDAIIWLDDYPNCLADLD